MRRGLAIVCSGLLALLVMTWPVRILAGPVVAARAPAAAEVPGDAVDPTASGNASEPPRYTIEIRPELELLAGVLSQTSWIKIGHPERAGSIYFQDLKRFFSAYRDDPAVRLAEQLTRDGFTYDAPPTFILHLGPLPDLDLLYDYDDYLVQRAGGRDRLEAFRLALRELAVRSDFAGFVDRWRDDYGRWIDGVSFEGNSVIDWLESFFGVGGGEYHVILAPSLFPGGGYGPLITTPDGRRLIYQIVRVQGAGTGDPDIPTGPELKGQAFHEWGHSFVNPVLAPYAEQLKALAPLYRPVRRAMRRMAYADEVTFFNEQVLRAITSFALEGGKGPTIQVYEPFRSGTIIATTSDLETAIRYHESLGFYLTRDVVSILREYQRNRGRYPDFRSFVPRLLTGLGECEPKRFELTSGNLVAIAFSIWALWLIGPPVVRWVRRRRLKPRRPPEEDAHGTRGWWPCD